MYCPKCGGGAYLADEDLIRPLETTNPVKLLIKQTFVCRACAERFSRVVWDDLASRKRVEASSPGLSDLQPAARESSGASDNAQDDASAGIQFLDRL